MRTLRSFSTLFTLLVMFALLGFGQRAAQNRPGQRAEARLENAQPKVVMHNGRPAIEFEGPEGWGFYIWVGVHQGESSLGFAVAQGDCQGTLYVTHTRVSGDFRNTNCDDFDVPRAGSNAERRPGKIVITSGSSKYEFVPQGERGNERHAVPVMTGGAEIVRAVNNFDATFRNMRRIIMADQRKAAPAASSAQPQTSPAGTLTITSNPGDAQVFVNNVEKGLTDTGGHAVVSLPAGSYHVRLSLEGYKDAEQQVTLAAGKNQEVSLKLEPTGPPPFTTTDMTEMLQGKMSPKRIATLVQERGVDFEVNPDTEKRLRALGATSDLLLVIAENKKK